MSRQQRSKLLNHQNRAFTEGTVEYINQQWVFFDTPTDDASAIEDYIQHDIEIYRRKRWRKGVLKENGIVEVKHESYYLLDKEKVRIKKQLLYSFERLLEELNDDAFLQFVTTLNSLNMSIYDCIYSYNQLTFLRELKDQNGVNFLIFDNGDEICSVQHHFVYSKKEHDRFEFTMNTGKRVVIEKMNHYT